MAVVVAATPQQDLNNLYKTAQAQQTQAASTNLIPTTATTTPVSAAIAAPTAAPTTAAPMMAATTATTPAAPTAQGADIILPAAEQARIKALQDQWNAATAAGNTAGAQAAHDAAQAIRAQYGYSGGAAGNQYITAGTTGVTGGDVTLPAAEQQRIAQLQQQYAAAQAAGNQAGMQAAHAAAEAIRAQYGYSGGAAGGQFTPVTPTAPQYTGTDLPMPTSNVPYINDMYAAQTEANRLALEAAYNNATAGLDAAAGRIPGQYQAAQQQAQQQAEIQRRSFNEQAAASGLNVGAGSQAQLAMGNQLQQNLSGIATAQSNALADLELQRTQLNTQYQSNVSQAIAEGNFQKAAALVQEYQRLDAANLARAQAMNDEMFRAYQTRASNYGQNQDALIARAQTLASIGDFSLFSQLGYTPEQITALTNAYQAAQRPASTGGGGGGNYAPDNTPASKNYKAGNAALAKKQADTMLGMIGIGNVSPNEIVRSIGSYLDSQVQNGYITYDEGRQILQQYNFLK